MSFIPPLASATGMLDTNNGNDIDACKLVSVAWQHTMIQSAIDINHVIVTINGICLFALNLDLYLKLRGFVRNLYYKTSMKTFKTFAYSFFYVH